MTTIDYIGFDIHKKTISFCVKAPDGTILEEGTIPTLRKKLLDWAKARPRPVAIQRRLLKQLREHHELSQRVMRLQTIPGVGEIVALSLALEVGEADRLPSVFLRYARMWFGDSREGFKTLRSDILYRFCTGTLLLRLLTTSATF